MPGGGYPGGGGGYYNPTPAATQAELTNVHIIAMEGMGVAMTAAAIALGLDKDEAVEFCERAYHMVRGQGHAFRYEVMITLAYEIKNRAA